MVRIKGKGQAVLKTVMNIRVPKKIRVIVLLAEKMFRIFTRTALPGERQVVSQLVS
jgi:hypothetical protein